MLRRGKWLITVMIAIIMFISGCSYSIGSSRSSSKKSMKASFSALSGLDKKSIEIKEGSTVKVQYDVKVDKGQLSVKLIDPDNKEAMSFEPNTKGEKELKAEKGGTYNIVIEADKAKGKYSLEWNIGN